MYMYHRYQDLQSAHMELGKAMSDPNTNANKLAKYRSTVKMQEEVCVCLRMGALMVIVLV